MPVRVTPQALDVIRRSLELSGADPSQVGVRLRVAGGEVRPRFTTSPEPSDVVVEFGGIRIFVASAIVSEHGLVEIGVTDEHDRLVVLPLPSEA